MLPRSLPVLVMTALLATTAGPAATGSPAAAVASAAPAAATAPANSAPTPLDKYLDDLHTLRTSFLQTLADPHGREIDRATGTLIVQRPGRFSWDVHPQPVANDASGANATRATGAGGAGQLMVCDGTNLWFYDRDLQQVTVKPVDAALSATPAMLLSGAVDVRKSFTISQVGEREGLDWVLVEPAGTQADFRSALFGFERAELRRMILEDKLDQTATIVFQKIERNGPVRPGEVSFKPPAGADVIGTPRK
ncbi:MAG TPA: outer-membrane lipoprotein carrier protein LolA [Steroidobacteraceae bacterium]|nr:outer-membrane lipoprotein carrier protein LolA [Steroidobacteraceae bacterium]